MQKVKGTKSDIKLAAQRDSFCPIFKICSKWH